MEGYTDREQYAELEDMRSQLATLKEKLESQEIISQKILRKTVSRKMDGITKFRNRVFALGAIAIMFTSTYFYRAGFSMYFIGYAELMILFSMFMTYRFHQGVESGNNLNDNLLTTAKELKRLKRNYNRSYFYSIPMVVVFIVWFFYEIRNIFEEQIAEYMIIGAAVGVIVGFVGGVSMNRKLVRMCDEIILDIEGE